MLTPPCPFGHELAGVVVEIGPEQETFDVGDRVAIANSAPCGSCRSCRLDRQNLCTDLEYLNGAFAERILVPARFARTSVYRLRPEIPIELAPLAEPLACVLHGLERIGRLVAANRDPTAGFPGGVLQAGVFGAGPLGLLLAGHLKRLGLEVVAVDPHQDRLALARRFGVVRTVCTREDAGLAGQLDLAIDASGTFAGWQAARDAVRDGGTAVFFGGTMATEPLELDPHRLHYAELAMLGVYHYRPAEYSVALDCLARGDLPYELLITREQPLAELPAALAAMRERTALKVRLRPKL